MANEEKTGKQGLKERLDEHLHPPESEDARHEKLALEALVSLLGSENETIRLQAAQAILSRPRTPPATSGTTDVTEVIEKLIKRK